MWAFVDGNWVDIGSLLVGISYAWWNCLRKCQKKISKATAVDVANGASLFPLLLLGLSFLSSKLLSELMLANKLILSVAGLCALLSMLEDDF